MASILAISVESLSSSSVAYLTVFATSVDIFHGLVNVGYVMNSFTAIDNFERVVTFTVAELVELVFSAEDWKFFKFPLLKAAI